MADTKRKRLHKCSAHLIYIVIFGRPFWECSTCGKQWEA